MGINPYLLRGEGVADAVGTVSVDDVRHCPLTHQVAQLFGDTHHAPPPLLLLYVLHGAFVRRYKCLFVSLDSGGKKKTHHFRQLQLAGVRTFCPFLLKYFCNPVVSLEFLSPHDLGKIDLTLPLLPKPQFRSDSKSPACHQDFHKPQRTCSSRFGTLPSACATSLCTCAVQDCSH